mmetsp:Transcript_54516/g.127405  ORF Transcript_54516/g.127405 Transcript_54516/m.127405 type:complete len:411 (-) Transcript_54516:108-1340(-)
MGVGAFLPCSAVSRPQLVLHVVTSRDASNSACAHGTALRAGDELRLQCLQRLPQDCPLRYRWSAKPRTMVISMRELDPLTDSMGVRLSEDREVTALCSEVAEKAGWQLGDVIVAVGLDLVHSQGDVVKAIQTAKISLQLDNKPITFLVQRPPAAPGDGIEKGVAPEEDPNKQLLGATVPQEFWRAQLQSFPNPELRKACPSGWCLLQVSSAPNHRTKDIVSEDQDVCEDVAELGDRFNEFVARSREEGLVSGSGLIEVCVPSVASVTSSGRLDFAAVGDHVLLHPYPFDAVDKFVSSSNEASLESELAHEFFHYCAWVAGGTKAVWDLQGMRKQDGSVLLVTPCMMRSGDISLGHLLEAVMPKLPNQTPTDLIAQHFQAAHPKCAPLCHAFDARRNAAKGTGLLKCVCAK